MYILINSKLDFNYIIKRFLSRVFLRVKVDLQRNYLFIIVNVFKL